MTAPRRFKLIAGLAATAALLAGAFASPAGAADLITASDNFFGPPTTFTMSQGENPTLQNNGSNPHNVTATSTGPDGGPLFRSATISGGSTPANGTQYLTAGSYPFICTIHPATMQGTLNVSASGTPQPRPRISLKLSSRKLAKVAKKGRLRVAITSSASADDASVTAKLGKATIARASGLSLFAGRQFAVLRLGKKAKAKLAKRTKATIVLKGTVAFGSPATAKGKLK